jgi:hypothetical protein
MRMLSLAAIALGALLLAAPPAFARDVSYVMHAVSVHIQPPDDWKVEDDPSGPLNLVSPDSSASITISIIIIQQPPDDLAAYILQQLNADPAQKEPAALTISGYSASAYRSALTNKTGQRKNLRFVTLRMDSGAVMICMVMTQENLPADRQEAVDALLATIALAPAS